MAEAADTPPSAGTQAAYHVEAIQYGTLKSTKSALYYSFASYGEADAEAELAYYFWLLRGSGGTVLVDTGFHPDAAARRGRHCVISPIAALQALGVSPGSVSTVIVTHFHYDHIGNLSAFPDAQLIVPRRELEFWQDPVARRSQFAHHVERDALDLLERAHAEGRVQTTEGEQEILPGVSAISVGGHSPGQQLTLVQGTDGPVLLTSDAVHLYEELELDRPFGLVCDLAAMYRAYDRVRELAAERGAAVVPGHDPEVMRRFPAGETGTDLTVRLCPTAGAERDERRIER